MKQVTVGIILGGGLLAPLFMMNQRSYSALDLLWLTGAFIALWIIVSLLTRVLSTRLVRATEASPGALQPLATLLKYGLIFVGVIVIRTTGQRGSGSPGVLPRSPNSAESPLPAASLRGAVEALGMDAVASRTARACSRRSMRLFRAPTSLRRVWS